MAVAEVLDGIGDACPDCLPCGLNEAVPLCLKEPTRRRAARCKHVSGNCAWQAGDGRGPLGTALPATLKPGRSAAD